MIAQLSSFLTLPRKPLCVTVCCLKRLPGVIQVAGQFQVFDSHSEPSSRHVLSPPPPPPPCPPRKGRGNKTPLVTHQPGQNSVWIKISRWSPVSRDGAPFFGSIDLKPISPKIKINIFRLDAKRWLNSIILFNNNKILDKRKDLTNLKIINRMSVFWLAVAWEAKRLVQTWKVRGVGVCFRQALSIIGGSCHKYHFCCDKHVCRHVCRDKHVF